jgi:hypothetical protein
MHDIDRTFAALKKEPIGSLFNRIIRTGPGHSRYFYLSDLDGTGWTYEEFYESAKKYEEQHKLK